MALKNLRNLINLDQTNLETLGDKKNAGFVGAGLQVDFLRKFGE